MEAGKDNWNVNELHSSVEEGKAVVRQGRAQGQIPPMPLKVRSTSWIMGSGDRRAGKQKTEYTLMAVSGEEYANPTNKHVTRRMVETMISSRKPFVIVSSRQHLN